MTHSNQDRTRVPEGYGISVTSNVDRTQWIARIWSSNHYELVAERTSNESPHHACELVVARAWELLDHENDMRDIAEMYTYRK